MLPSIKLQNSTQIQDGRQNVFLAWQHCFKFYIKLEQQHNKK
jgi:hypothetical protein